MKLYTYYQSGAAYRVRIALNLKGIQPEMAFVNLLKGEQRKAAYAHVNAHMLVPSLVDGGHTFGQSLAIMEYLEETHPKPAILPDKPLMRAYVRELSLAISCDTSPLHNLRVRNYLSETMGQDKDTVERWVRYWIKDGLEALEKILEDSYAGEYCFEDRPTMADCCLIPQLYNAKRFGVETVHLPNITRIAANCGTHPAFKAAHPDKQPDAASKP